MQILIILLLTSISPNINLFPPNFFWFLFAWCIVFCLFFSKSLYVLDVSYKHHIARFKKIHFFMSFILENLGSLSLQIDLLSFVCMYVSYILKIIAIFCLGFLCV